MITYPESFLANLGKKGYDQRIDDILDEINHWRKFLKEL